MLLDEINWTVKEWLHLISIASGKNGWVFVWVFTHLILLSFASSCSWYFDLLCAFDFWLWIHIPWKFTCRNSLRLRVEALFFYSRFAFVFDRHLGTPSPSLYLQYWLVGFWTIPLVCKFRLQIQMWANLLLQNLNADIFLFTPVSRFMHSRCWIVKIKCWDHLVLANTLKKKANFSGYTYLPIFPFSLVFLAIQDFIHSS